jgi:hypothetical protein
VRRDEALPGARLSRKVGRFSAAIECVLAVV